MTQLTIDLEPEDFEPMERREEHKYYLGLVYPFMGVAHAALDVAQVVVSKRWAEFRFETATGEPWGGLEPEFWAQVEAEELLKRGGFLVARLWTKQQVRVAEDSLKKEDASYGFSFKYGAEVRAAFGVPARVVIRF